MMYVQFMGCMFTSNWDKMRLVKVLDDMGLIARKQDLGGLRTTQAQTSRASAQSDQCLSYSLFGKCHI